MVVNFAAESHVDRSIENPEVFLDTNIKGTAVLMDACRKYGIKRYHQVSTDEVYGDLPLDSPDLFFTEETPIHTSSPYSSVQRQQQTYWFLLTTEHMDFLLQSADVPTTMDHIISQRN